MEEILPLPMPDRRIINNKENPTENFKFQRNEHNNELAGKKISELKFNELKESKLSNISNAQIKQIEDMRQKIISYKLLSDKTIYINSFLNNQKIEKCNIIIFGPSGVGKSSFIHSLYKSLYNTNVLPSQLINNIIIRKKKHDENILLFSQYHLVKETENNSGIMICDTNGNLKMNDNEKDQYKIILDGQLKDCSQIEKNANKDRNSLLDFWKKSNEMFPKEIFKSDISQGNIKSLPHCVVFVFDGSIDEIIQNEDIIYYQNLIWISKEKGYKDIHVILSKLDEFEKKIWERNKNLTENEIYNKLKVMKDIKIEKVISTLGVNRSNVHFIENYHLNKQNKNSVEIDYNILKTIIDILNSSELFIIDKMNRKQECFRFCI